MGTKEIVKAKTETVQKKFKVKLLVKDGDATIIREGLPIIFDKADKAVEWLAAKEYKPDEVELVGDKPSNWNSAFKIPDEVVSQLVEEVPVAPSAA